MSITTGILIILFALLLLSRKREKPAGKRRDRRASSRKRTKPPNPYASASVRQGDCACEGAKALEDKRFLSRDVPQLPLATCSAAQCGCRYVRHEDRRKTEDRREMFSLQSDLYSVSSDADRRLRSRGRRATDTADSLDLSEIDYDSIEWTT